METINISKLAHTWILDLDGTLLKHNGYLLNGCDELISSTRCFFSRIPDDDMIIILTSRKEEYRNDTEEFLKINGIRYDRIIFDVPVGERILINDAKPSGLKTAIAVNCLRDKGIDTEFLIESSL